MIWYILWYIEYYHCSSSLDENPKWPHLLKFHLSDSCTSLNNSQLYRFYHIIILKGDFLPYILFTHPLIWSAQLYFGKYYAGQQLISNTNTIFNLNLKLNFSWHSLSSVCCNSTSACEISAQPNRTFLSSKSMYCQYFSQSIEIVFFQCIEPYLLLIFFCTFIIRMILSEFLSFILRQKLSLNRFKEMFYFGNHSNFN